MIRIARFGYRHEAELAEGFLQGAGIDARVQLDDAGGMYVGLTFSGAGWLLVPEEQATEARRVLEECGFAEQLLTNS